ncbi:hypothetical protein BKA70DRAFT_18342 [Coprinopsis sp. MPI-PUGE-AT-0042]|nr:hypothetical protein BKA70DRAFT_18342 [Coprinopsis sp. MPI-PUGE-AT-0042]
MDSWPRDDQGLQISSNETDKDKKGRGRKGSNNRADYLTNAYPNLKQGMAGAATLVKKPGSSQLEWSFLQDIQKPQSEWKLASSSVAKVFPNTRPVPLPKARHTAKQKSEQGANFLRTHLPDVEIPAELIQDYIEEETSHIHQLEEYDPYAGSLLVSLTKPVVKVAASGYLAFATGEALTQLNVSSYEIYERQNGKGLRVRADPDPKVTFKTPIRQLTAASTNEEHFLAVRTFSEINILQLKKPGSSRTPATVATITKKDLGNAEAMDVVMQDSDVLVIDNSGVIHVQDFSAERAAVSSLSPFEANQEKDRRRFWRLALDVKPRHGFSVSSKQLFGFECRTRAMNSHWTLPEPKDYITSIEGCKADNIVRLCTTSNIVWLDQRNMRRPLVSLKHGREFDRYLQTQTLGTSSPATFLTTRRNNLVSIYDASKGGDGLLHVQSSPRGILLPFDFQSCLGETIISSPFEQDLANFVHFRLSEQGGIVAQHITSSATGKEFELRTGLSDEMKELEREEVKLKADTGPLGLREYAEVNMAPVYDKLFTEHYETAEKFEEAEAEAVYDLLDAFPSYFQRAEASSEQVMTTFDVAFRAGEDPTSSTRSDFLAGSLLNSVRGSRALKQGRLDPEPLRKTSAWHLNLDTILGKIDPSLRNDLQTGEGSFSAYDLADDENRPVQSLRLEKKAKEQLALDLALSKDIYSTQPLTKPAVELDHTLETMTEALTLHDDLPPIEFSYFKPVLKKKHYAEEEGQSSASGSNDKPGQGIATRLLLKEWEIGTSAERYEYRDPYGTVEGEAQKWEAQKRKEFGQYTFHHWSPRQLPPALQTQMQLTEVPPPPPRMVAALPPIIRASSSQSTQIAPPLKAGVSQQAFWTMQTQTQESQSQDMMPSTQVLPGPFGGRQTAKKKAVKKRVGGF